MAEKLPIPEPRPIAPNLPTKKKQDLEDDKLHATLEERIYTIIGTELLEKDYKPTTYAEAVLKACGEEPQIIYHYAKIRYKDLYERATQRLKHTSELKG